MSIYPSSLFVQLQVCPVPFSSRDRFLLEPDIPYRTVVRSLHNNPLRLLVPRQRLLPPLRRLAPGKDLVYDLSDILDKDKLDARLDRVGHVFVNVGFAGDGDDELFDACSVGC